MGTYRLGRREQLEKIGDFYTNVKFNVDSLMAAEGEVLELSRMAIRGKLPRRLGHQAAVEGTVRLLCEV